MVSWDESGGGGCGVWGCGLQGCAVGVGGHQGLWCVGMLCVGCGVCGVVFGAVVCWGVMFRAVVTGGVVSSVVVCGVVGGRGFPELWCVGVWC